MSLFVRILILDIQRISNVFRFQRNLNSMFPYFQPLHSGLSFLISCIQKLPVPHARGTLSLRYITLNGLTRSFNRYTCHCPRHQDSQIKFMCSLTSFFILRLNFCILLAFIIEVLAPESTRVLMAEIFHSGNEHHSSPTMIKYWFKSIYCIAKVELGHISHLNYSTQVSLLLNTIHTGADWAERYTPKTTTAAE